MSRQKSTLGDFKATFSNKLRPRHVESYKSEEKEQEEGTTLNKTWKLEPTSRSLHAFSLSEAFKFFAPPRFCSAHAQELVNYSGYKRVWPGFEPGLMLTNKSPQQQNSMAIVVYYCC